MRYFPPINGDQLDPDRPYINANPGAGIEGAWPDGRAIEGSMREILEVITEAGLTPDGEDFTQLYIAIQALIAANVAPSATTTLKGIVELATGAEALDGIDSTRAVTSAALASSKNYAAGGYQKLPGGLIIQWGASGAMVTTTAYGAEATLTLPVAFPNAALAGFVTKRQPGGYTNGWNGPYMRSISQTQIIVGLDDVASSGSDTLYTSYFAIGY